MSADLLRRAAALMRERAQAATQGRWLANGDDLAMEGPPIDVVALTTHRDVSADAEHIASWHPTVALAVADWLDECGTRVLATSAARLTHDDEERAWYLPALAVARAYLGEPS